MITRVKHADGLKTVMAATPALKEVNVDLDDWIKDNRNVCYTDGEGNYGAFEYNWPGVYTGHYFFGNARGRQALSLCKRILSIFADERDWKVIRGLTPTDHKGALWMNRQIGLLHHNIVETTAGPQWVSTMTRQSFEEKCK